MVGSLGRSEGGRLAQDARFGWRKCEAGHKQAKQTDVTGSQQAERSQCKKCSVITRTKTAQTKKKLPPEQIVQDWSWEDATRRRWQQSWEGSVGGGGVVVY